ncbi:helix-turn-helix transcriptional regulator [Anaerocolumna sp. AGMB13020]|uniref:helix-turn-helix domain-containing protein n=1 Tax=Anaerocolumna sp. AGMB13020 TaxID=3081750 RepID=UPI002952C502|nr:helix-turn-helix transcriptional regulator [Anaerocolumna sp. AGMB13020]WOO35053.1 helix-turn-helix transcriptional regulator [Anaerocolumna sp. AGMB13020]
MTMVLQNADLYLNLKKMRKSSGLSQYELVAQMQLLGSTMSRSTYAKIEQGSRNIKVTDIVALKKIYNVDFSEFFEGIGTC